jgi:hypothetical protein
MLPTFIKNHPSADSDFEALSEYQAQTPSTFFDSDRKPVLYFHDANIKAWCSDEHSERLFFFPSGDNTSKPSAPEFHALEHTQDIREDLVEVFVASRFVPTTPWQTNTMGAQLADHGAMTANLSSSPTRARAASRFPTPPSRSTPSRTSSTRTASRRPRTTSSQGCTCNSSSRATAATMTRASTP